MEDLYHSIGVKTAIAPIVVSDNTAKVGSIIDRLGFDSVTYVIQSGVLADADATFTVLLEEGNAADMSDASAVADADLLSTEAAASFTFSDDNVTHKLGYIGVKRYTRLTITPANNTASAPLSAVAVLSHANSQPVA